MLTVFSQVLSNPYRYFLVWGLEYGVLEWGMKWWKEGL